MKNLDLSPRPALLALRRLGPLLLLEERARRLELRQPLGFAARSRRLRLHVLEQLDGPAALRQLSAEELSALIAARLAVVAQPARAFMLRVLGVASAVALGLALVVGAVCAVSSDVRAFFFPPNLAARAKWEASSAFPGTRQEGVGAGSLGPLFFHTMEESNASLVITLPRRAAIDQVRIVNREDCCQERALPLNVETVGGGGERLLCQRRAPFSVWTCDGRGVVTRKLRIRHPGMGTLHLSKVEVFE